MCCNTNRNFDGISTKIASEWYLPQTRSHFTKPPERPQRQHPPAPSPVPSMRQARFSPDGALLTYLAATSSKDKRSSLFAMDMKTLVSPNQTGPNLTCSVGADARTTARHNNRSRVFLCVLWLMVTRRRTCRWKKSCVVSVSACEPLALLPTFGTHKPHKLGPRVRLPSPARAQPQPHRSPAPPYRILLPQQGSLYVHDKPTAADSADTPMRLLFDKASTGCSGSAIDPKVT